MLKWLTDIFGFDSGMEKIGSDLSDLNKPQVNIDGAPMVDDLDIHGNPFGVTQDDSFGGGGGFGGGFGNDDF